MTVVSNPISDENRPLDPSEREYVTEVALESPPVDQYSVIGGLYTGLPALALAHVQFSMVEETDSGILIRLPHTGVRCRSAHGKAGPEPVWRVDSKDDSDDGCACCSGTFEFRKPRVIPVREPIAVSMFQDFFSLYDGTPSVSAISTRLEKLGQQCGIDRLSSKVLRHTYPVILAEKGFTQSEIGDLMGWVEATVQAINFPERVGAYCAGENPFFCSAESEDGTRCEQVVLGRDELCAFHSPDATVCGAVIEGDERCEAVVSEPDERCVFHSENRFERLCGAELDNGEGRCERALPSSGEYDRCQFHREDGGFVCGAETGDGSECQRAVGGPDELCYSHRGG